MPGLFLNASDGAWLDFHDNVASRIRRAALKPFC